MKAPMLTPGASLLCKLASIAVHAEEYLSPHGHDLDREALLSVLADAEVRDWLAQMSGASLAPMKRLAQPADPKESEHG